jgi:tetratricopeptide (TPR) repeat protein
MTILKAANLWETIRRTNLTRVLVVYLGGSYAVLEISDIFVGQLGLPDWVFPGVITLLLLGLPIVVATALVQKRKPGHRQPQAETEDGWAAVSAQPATETPSGVTNGGPWLTWRRAILGFVSAFALWGIVVAGYMAMRALGVGPVGSLVAAGVLDARERLIIADFENNSSDLGRAATEAFRIDFTQSPIVTVVDPASVDQVLIRMQRDPQQPLDLELAREVAIREGIKAVVAGDITPVGSGFVMAARLISAPDGQVLAAYRESAGDSTAIIGAIDQLSKKLRERIGESLKSIRANEALDRVTTPSLEALRKYSQAVHVIEQGDDERGMALLEEAVASDSVFAMAWRKLGVVLGNMGRNPARQVEALTKAYENRERLTDRERYLTLGSYYAFVTGEEEKATAAYQSLLDIYPNDTWALNNLAIQYLAARSYARSDSLFRRAIQVDSASGALYYGNAISTSVALGNFSGAESILQRLSERFPDHPTAAVTAAALASSRFNFESSREQLLALRQAQGGSGLWKLNTSFMLAQLAEVQGRLGEAEDLIAEVMDMAEKTGELGLYLNGALRVALYDAMLRGDKQGAVSRVASALERHPLSSIDPLERPYDLLAVFFALVDEPRRARRYLTESEATIDSAFRQRAKDGIDVAKGVIALAENRPVDAVRELRLADRGPCPICILPLLGQAYDAAGQTDSVISIYERYIETPWLYRTGETDWYALAGIYERLGGLYELRGDSDKALYYYGQFVRLWSEADKELQPRVDAARRAQKRLSTDALTSSLLRSNASVRG